MPAPAPPRGGRAGPRRRWRRAPPGPARRAAGGWPSSRVALGAAQWLAVPGGVLPAPAPRRGGRRVGGGAGLVLERRGLRDLPGHRDQPVPGRGFLVQGRRDAQRGFRGAGRAGLRVVIGAERVVVRCPRSRRVADPDVVVLPGARSAADGHAGHRGLRPPQAAGRPGPFGALLLGAFGALLLDAFGALLLGGFGALLPGPCGVALAGAFGGALPGPFGVAFFAFGGGD